MEDEDIPVRTIDLPNGSSLIMQANATGPRLVFMMKGLSMSCEVLDENEFENGSDQWANREIELYEQALDIDLKAHADFIKECLKNGQTETQTKED